VGCGAATRHKVLTTLFDGVPPLKTATAPAATGAQPGAATDASAPAPSRGSVHGPYGARMCGECHAVKAGFALVAPREQLCLNCHQFAPAPGMIVHGPLAAGGCLVCHEPHNSPNRALLVSDSDTFCFRCHDRDRLRGHAGGETRCTACHDAHMSPRRYLLK